MGWMAWTRPTAIFFGCIIGLLAIMTIWELRSPTTARRGFLPMPTTRGDRLFIGLLGTAFIHIIWLALTTWTLWPASGLSLLLMLVIGRWG